MSLFLDSNFLPLLEDLSNSCTIKSFSHFLTLQPHYSLQITHYTSHITPSLQLTHYTLHLTHYTFITAYTLHITPHTLHLHYTSELTPPLHLTPYTLHLYLTISFSTLMRTCPIETKKNLRQKFRSNNLFL